MAYFLFEAVQYPNGLKWKRRHACQMGGERCSQNMHRQMRARRSFNLSCSWFQFVNHFPMHYRINQSIDSIIQPTCSPFYLLLFVLHAVLFFSFSSMLISSIEIFRSKKWKKRRQRKHIWIIPLNWMWGVCAWDGRDMPECDGNSARPPKHIARFSVCSLYSNIKPCCITLLTLATHSCGTRSCPIIIYSESLFSSIFRCAAR